MSAAGLADWDSKVIGESPGDDAGWPVSHGDLNGDGVADLLVGATYGNDKRGALYVLIGGSGF